MAVITTTTTPEPNLINWTVPPGAFLDRTLVPRGEVIFEINPTIPAKILDNESVWNLVCNLPLGYGYKFCEMRLNASVISGGVAQLDEWENGMHCSLDDDRSPPQTSVQHFTLVNETLASIAVAGFVTSADGTNAENEWGPLVMPSTMLQCGKVGTFTITWIDATSASTVATVVRAYIRLLQYDLEQIRNFRVRSPLPVFAP